MTDRLPEIVQRYGGPALTVSVDPYQDLMEAARNIDWLVDQLEAAREVVAALQRWERMPGHFFGPTPEEGSEVGKAMKAYLAMTASVGGGS